MTLPITGNASLVLAVVFGLIFGLLLQRGRVADYNTIVNQFRFKDFTVLKVMFTAIVVGGIGVLVLHQTGHAAYHIKPANMLGVVLGRGSSASAWCPTAIVLARPLPLLPLAAFTPWSASRECSLAGFVWPELHVG